MNRNAAPSSVAVQRMRVAAAIAILVVFVISRAALLITSYDANRNWEEPVFLFSATELQREGVSHIFEHQDDLNHGGSLVLLLLAVPWISLFGTSLVALKGVAILWSALTLCVLMGVAWRYFSVTVALLLGLFYLGLSPTLARINVTLVGSHPEALLPCTLALGFYLDVVQRRTARTLSSAWVIAASAFTSGLALWVAYLSAMFVVPLFLLQALFLRSKRGWALVGLLLGVAPWIYQNVWLHPRAAGMWLAHLGGTRMPAMGWLHTIEELAGSFGYRGVGGLLLVLVCMAAWLVIVAGLWRMPGNRPRPHAVLAVLPLLLAPLLGLALLAYAAIPEYPNEGYFHYRFFIPLQVSLFWLLAIAIDWLTMWFGRRVLIIAMAAAVFSGIWGQAPLYATGNHYQSELEHDRGEGCAIYGLAEWGRSQAVPEVLQRLSRLTGEHCRDRAFGGFGWGLASRYLEQRDPQAMQDALVAVDDDGQVHFTILPGSLGRMRRFLVRRQPCP